MKVRILAMFMALSLVSCDPNTFNEALGGLGGTGGIPLSTEQVAKGLKQALEIGIEQGATKLSQVNGYLESPYKILLPPEAQKVEQTLRDLGAGALVDEAILKINRGAEDAAKRAAPIFKRAITQMSFQDAMGILMGQQDAATTYLHSATYQNLYTAFNPVIVNSLDSFGANKAWNDIITRYNKIPLVQKVNPDLDDYVTTQALTGLFSMVEKKEVEIRSDVNARTTDLLRKVFAKQDN